MEQVIAPAPLLQAPPVLPAGALQLLVLQASPFCNLDCRYCYLPERGNTQRMALPLLRRVLAQVRSSGLMGPELSLVWHAGEPMALPRSWYDDAFAIVAEQLHGSGTRVVHHFQTNAVLIDEAWCDFFHHHGVQVGVSIDGPAALHDSHRQTRDGRGTHAKVMQGIAQLKAAGLPFHAIAVLTADALGQPDALFDFFAGLDARQVGFNVEEIEAEHTTSTLQAPAAESALRAFWARILQRLQAEPGRLRVRELDAVVAALRHPQLGTLAGSSQNQSGHLLNVAHNGDWCFWSPELLGTHHPQRGPVVMGNLALGQLPRAGAPAAGAAWADWQVWQTEINHGVAACRANCAYFDICLGGAPANKLAEHGHLSGTATMACRMGQQVVIDAVLESLDRNLPVLA